MGQEQQTGNGSIWKEVSSAGYLDRVRARASKRTSPWNLLLIPLFLAGFFLIPYVLFRCMWAVHIFLYPAHNGHLGEFWGRGIGFPSFVSSFLLLIPLVFAGVPMSMMMANCITWFIPAARGAFRREGEVEPAFSFPVAMRQLWRVSRVMVPICLLLSLVGAGTLVNLR